MSQLRCRVRWGWSKKMCCRRKHLNLGLYPQGGERSKATLVSLCSLNTHRRVSWAWLSWCSFLGLIPDRQNEIPRGRPWVVRFFSKFPLERVRSNLKQS